MREDFTKTKLVRTTKDYGGGSGSRIYESDLFRVVCWSHGGGELRTTVEIKLADNLEFAFDGHKKLLSDVACFAQLEAHEILLIVDVQKRKAFNEGMEAKAKEIRKALFI
jgi:hypothetical protein